MPVVNIKKNELNKRLPMLSNYLFRGDLCDRARPQNWTLARQRTYNGLMLMDKYASWGVSADLETLYTYIYCASVPDPMSSLLATTPLNTVREVARFSKHCTVELDQSSLDQVRQVLVKTLGLCFNPHEGIDWDKLDLGEPFLFLV